MEFQNSKVMLGVMFQSFGEFITLGNRRDGEIVDQTDK